MKGFAQYWGYLAFVVLIFAWLTRADGPAFLIVLSLFVSSYFLFQAPVWCRAVSRDGTVCRNNSSGLLFGCSKRHHKWQKLKMTTVPHAWRQLNSGLWASRREGSATLGALAGLISTIAATFLVVADQVAA
jgi:hypothetical protein